MSPSDVTIRTYTRPDLAERLAAWEAFVDGLGRESPSLRPGWLDVCARGLKHVPYCLEARRGERIVGLLPLEYISSLLFGRFLVGLPYLNTGGVIAEDEAAGLALVDEAVGLADRLDVKYLELRHERPIKHAALGHKLTSKVHMRLALPETSDQLWDSFKPKVRNQIRKGEKVRLSVHWGGDELLAEFYDVFARNMRDLGTPVFSRRLFGGILSRFPDRAELCVVRLGTQAVAAAVLVHGPGMTEVPSASSLRPYNHTNANMLMYWHLLCRSIERRQRVFDFGRSTVDSNTFRFKKQWGAQPEPAIWQYYLRRGTIGEMRPENSRYQRMVRAWQRLPVPLTRLIGPPIVRGIP